jgi:hypothetical protein
MNKQTDDFELKPGDLCLMAVVKSSKSGPTLFEMIDKTGYLEEEDTSSLQDSQSERQVMDSANTGHPEGEDLGSEVSPHSEIIATLESQRAVLDQAIQQLRQDAAGIRNEQAPGSGRQIPPSIPEQATAALPRRSRASSRQGRDQTSRRD